MMGLRMRLHDGEPIGQALRRFKRLLARHGQMWEQRRHAHFVPATQIRRAKRLRKRFKARRATLLAQRAGEQPVASLNEAVAELWRRSGRP
jgi:small subunit ribosomal protein S21